MYAFPEITQPVKQECRLPTEAHRALQSWHAPVTDKAGRFQPPTRQPSPHTSTHCSSRVNELGRKQKAVPPYVFGTESKEKYQI